MGLEVTDREGRSRFAKPSLPPFLCPWPQPQRGGQALGHHNRALCPPISPHCSGQRARVKPTWEQEWPQRSTSPPSPPLPMRNTKLCSVSGNAAPDSVVASCFPGRFACGVATYEGKRGECLFGLTNKDSKQSSRLSASDRKAILSQG